MERFAGAFSDFLRADLLIEQVTDICYEKAVTAVSESMSQTALDKAAAGVDRTIREAKSPGNGLGAPFIGMEMCIRDRYIRQRANN